MILFGAMGWPTIVALVIIVLIVGGLIAKLIVDKVKGKSSCSCGCSGCAMKDMCHSKDARGTKPSEQEMDASGQSSDNIETN